MLQTKHAEKIKTRILCLSNFFSKILPFMRQRRKVLYEHDRPQMTIWRMRIACWIHKAKYTQSEYVIILSLHSRNGCTNVSQSYVIVRYLSCRNMRYAPTFYGLSWPCSRRWCSKHRNRTAKVDTGTNLNIMNICVRFNTYSRACQLQTTGGPNNS